ncbi:PLP-dependent aminotransferase family protein [Phascolarctobacterium sp.]|uniref:MocR-like pyridoxine biosynthesis transcription factor PdxR n=1 Tax=Phascolarctobacterium sp. TaxID=2049039 RepID=UPI003870C262
MLTYSFANLKGVSMYAHLYQCIKNDIVAGTLKAQEKLPSKRTLAKNLGISLITVENAYAQLLVEGYIYSKPRRGYFVASLEQQTPLPQKQLPTPIQNPSPERTLTSFVRSSVPPDTFPYNTWARLLRHTLTSADEHALISDSSAGGVLALRQALAKHLYQFRGLNVNPEQIIIGAGTQTLYNLIVQLLGRNRIYALEDPGYPQLAAIYRTNDVFCRYLPMDEKGITADVLAVSGADILHITPSHQFPTGITMPVSRRYELLRWANAGTSRYIIEDDYDCEFRLFGKPVPPLQSIDHGEKVIYINTFSKTLAPTFRISYMLLPLHLATLFYQKLGFYSCTVSNFEQFTLAKFIEDGYFERHLNRMRTYYRNKRDTLLNYLATCPAAPALQVEGENSGLHFLLRLKTEAGDSLLKQVAADAGLEIKFLSDYYHEKLNDTSHTMLMNYTGLEDARLYPALDKLFTALLPYLKV